MKRAKLLLICVLTLLVSGCSKTRTAMEPDDFSKILSKYDYKLLDKTDTVDYADAAYIVNTDNFEFTYVNGKRKYDIEGLFVEECKNIVNMVGNKEYDKDLDSGENYAYLEIKTDETYYYVSWIDDTYIYVKAPIVREKKLKEIINELGY